MERRQIMVLAGVALLGLAVGGAGGYFLGRKQAAEQFEVELTTEIQAARDHYATQYKTEFATPEEAVKALIGDIPEETTATPQLVSKLLREAKDRTDYNAISNGYRGTETPASTVRSNIWDKKQALPARGPNGQFVKQEVGPEPNETPYIIDEETFLQNDTEFDQEEVTYHFRDNTILDAQGDVVENEILGEVNLTLLKADALNHPDDDNTIYIRNEKITMEYCVVTSEESVAAIHGLDQDD